MAMYTLTVDLLAKTSSFEKDLGKAARVQERAARAARQMQRELSDSFSQAARDAKISVASMEVSMAGLAKGFGLIGGGALFGMLVSETVNAQNELAQLNATLKSTGQAAGYSSVQLVEMADRMAKATVQSSGDIVNAQTRLLSYTSIVGENFPRALQLAIDQSVRLGEEVTQSAESIGKALEYPAEGISSLTKQGFRFTDQQKELLKSLADTGRLGEAQALVMGVMEESYAGAGRAARETLGGALIGVRESFNDLLGSGSNSGPVHAATSALNAFAENMDAVAAAALPLGAAVAVFYAGGKLQKGLVGLNALWTAHSIVAGRATVGLMGMTAATTRLTVAQTAAAVAGRGLSSAYAMIGGPVGVAAAGVTAVGYGLVLASQAARENAESFNRLKLAIDEIAQASIDARKALDGGGGSAAAVEEFGRMIAPLRTAQLELDALQEKLERLRDDSRTATRGDGGAALSYFSQIEKAEAAIEQLERSIAPATAQVDAMEKALRARLGPAFVDVQSAVEQLRQDGNLEAFIGKIGSGVQQGITDLTRLEERFRSLSSSIKDAVVNLPGQIERIGKGAKDLAVLDLRDALQAGLDSGQMTAGSQAWNDLVGQGTEYIRLRIRQEAAEKSFSETKKMAAAADRAAGRDQKQAEDSMRRYAKEAAMATAVLQGPLAEAVEKQRQREAELTKELNEGNIARAAYNILVGESKAALENAQKAIEKAAKGPEELLGSMQQEVLLLGLSGTAREMYRRQLQAEADMRGEIARAMDAGAKFSDDEIKQLMAQSRGYAELSIAMEEAGRAAEDWHNVAVDAVGGVADVFADLFGGQIRKAKDFFSELKDVFKRGWWDVVRTGLQQSFVNPIQKAIQGMLTGQGFAATGSSYGGIGSTIAGGIVNGVSRAGLGGLGVGPGAIGGFGNNIAGWGGFQGGMYGIDPAVIAAGGGSGGFGGASMLANKSLLTGEFAGGMPYAGAALGLMGAYYGFTQRGNGGFSSAAAGLSYGAAGLAAGGAIAGGMGAVGAGAGLGGIGAGAMGGATGAMGAIGGAAWVPVVGWALAALAVVDMVSGGKVFGTKYKTDGSQQTLGINEAGGSATATADQSRQKALFGGKKRRTINVEASGEAKEAAKGMHDMLSSYAKQLGVTLQQDAAALVGGSFKQTYDKKGNLKAESSTVLGRTYSEDVEAFQKRLAAEQAIAAVAKIDGQASAIAEDWRKSAETLEAGANFFMAAAVDARSGMDLWTGIGLGVLTDFVAKMQTADETLQATYSRLAGLAKNYGTLMADVSTQLMTGDLSNYQSQALTIERTYRQQVKSANDYAKALGLTGARAEDLAKIEELRAVSMGKLQAQIEADKKSMLYGLSISDLSPLTDREKLDKTMRELAEATANGDSSAAQAAAQAALGFGRDLFASGKDYNALYGQVTGLIGSMKLGELDLEDGTSIGQLADAIEALPETFGRAVFEVAASGAKEQAQTTAQVQQSNQLLQEQNELLKKLLNTAQGSASTVKRETMNATLNHAR